MGNDDNRNQDKGSMSVILYLVVIFICMFVVGIICCFKYIEKEDKVESLQSSKEQSTQSSKEQSTQLQDVVDNFKYNVYFEIDAEWNGDFTDEDIQQLVSMGLTKEDINGSSVLAIAGQVDGKYEMVTILNQSQLLPYINSSGTQMFVDTEKDVSYTANTKMGSQTKRSWVKDTYTDESLTLNSFVKNIEWTAQEEQDEYICDKGVYHITDDNYITLILEYIESTYALNIPDDISVIAYKNKDSGKIEKLEYDLTSFNNATVYSNYNVTDVKCNITFADINNVKLELPEEVKNN